MTFSIPDEPRATPGGGVLHVPAAEGVVKWMSGDVYTIKAARSDTNGTLSFVHAIVPPGSGPVAHSHGAEDEAFYLLSGELEFLDGEKTFVAEAGSFVFIPRRHRHRFKNISSKPAETLFLFTPAGPEQLFVQGGDEPVPGALPEPWAPERFMKLAPLIEQLGSTILPE
ncbi:cupin domain-containing protein [Actinoplanes sp. NPDC049265]|uniref:cupin domain-containing protein n=1 Tax=Actinoplanes sp. NPDC049265 TaxID=3363902 RepID=UPI00371C87EF